MSIGEEVGKEQRPQAQEPTPAEVHAGASDERGLLREHQSLDLAGTLASVVERPGGWIGHHKLLSILGEGGMGIVYLAEQEQPIKRKVALKVVKPGMDSARVLARFEAERQTLALLDHPNIAHIFEAGTTDSGRPYFVTEYVKGCSITDYGDSHKLTIEERLHLFLQVCLAVHHAHQKGIIHRDLKPSNILVSEQDGRPVPTIIDFGVAKAIVEPLTKRTPRTEDSQLLGTPEYMSPEQVDMVNEDIDTRSDVYSLGVLLYVLLTGVLPFDPEELRESGVEHIRKTIRETDPKTPSTRLSRLGDEAETIAQNRGTQVHALARHLRKELEWIPLKAMRKDRSKRYRSASELADDIGNYLKGAPLIAGPPSTIYRVQKFLRRNRALVTGVAAVLAVLMAGVVVSMVLAFGQARARAEAQAVSDFLQNVLASLDRFKVGGREISDRSVLDAAAESLEGQFTGSSLAEAEIQDKLGNAYWSLGLYQQAESHLRRALGIRQIRRGREHPASLASAHLLGWVYYAQSRYDEAEQLLVQTWETRRRVLGERHDDTLASQVALACVYNMRGRFQEAEQLIVRALNSIQSVPGKEHPYMPAMMNALAWNYELRGQYGEAEQTAKQGLDVSRRTLGESDWFTLLLKSTLGRTYELLGRYDEAEELLQEALNGRRDAWGKEHPDTLQAMADLGWLYCKQGRYKEAETLLDEALEAALRVLGEAHITTAHCLRGLGTLSLCQGRHREAEPLLEKALEIVRSLLGEESYLVPKATNALARLYSAEGRYEEAQKTFRRTLELRRRIWDAEHLEILETTNDLGALRREQQLYEEAASLLREALEGRQRKLGPDHPARFESVHELALLYIAKEDYDKAEPLLLEAFHGREAKLGPDHPHTIESLNQLAHLYESWNKPDEAEKWRVEFPAAPGTGR